MSKRTAKITAVCGRICTGKTSFSNELVKEGGTVLLSCDEISTMIFRQQLGDKHDETMLRVKEYQLKKSVEIAANGCSVVLDWGFWSKAERRMVDEYFRSRGFEIEWHYLKVSDDIWFEYIAERNQKVKAGLSQDYYIDEGLLKKAQSLFEEPEPDELRYPGFIIHETYREKS